LHPALGPKSNQEVDATFRLAGKTLVFEECDLRGRFYTITVSGIIGLDGALDLRVKVKFLHEGADPLGVHWLLGDLVRTRWSSHSLPPFFALSKSPSLGQTWTLPSSTIYVFFEKTFLGL
jgi:hypothetical protein